MLRFISYFNFALYINIFVVKSMCVLLSAFSLIKANIYFLTQKILTFFFSDTKHFSLRLNL